MTLFSIKIQPLDISDRLAGLVERILSVVEGGQSTQFEELKTLITQMGENIMAEVDDFKKVAGDLTREVGQNSALITQLKEQIGGLQTQVDAGASDKALAAAVREAMPELTSAVTQLDANTPETEPEEEEEPEG